ncbi:MAG: hypothetical protein IPK16_23695 [Anaerolineales bacterium]|nr:hypothetical protein [Anaerolineales bacterium]
MANVLLLAATVARQDLLQIVRRLEDFPIVAETYRDCLEEVMDWPNLERALTRIQQGKSRSRWWSRWRRRRWRRACCMTSSASICMSGMRRRPSGSCRR